MGKSEEAVVVRNAFKYYGTKKDPRIVLNHLDMNVEKGTIYGLLGSSGCGKTTLLTCIIGRRPLMSGNITVLGETSPDKFALRLGYMPQEVALVSEFSVKEAVYFFGRIYGFSDSKIREQFQLLFELLDLPDENRMIKNCSGGQQRRASFAAALVHQPELLILDEPTVGLDPVLRARIWEHLIHLATVKKTTIIITTHYIEEARQAQRIGLMRGGKLLAEEPPSSLMSRYNCGTLEEVYLILSIKQSKSEGGCEDPEMIAETEDVSTEDIVVESKDKSPNSSSDPVNDCEEIAKNNEVSKPNDTYSRKSLKRSFYYKWKKMQALFFKNVHQFFRHPGGLGFSLLFPFLELLSFFIAIGHDPRELTLAIVNDEVPMWDDCLLYNNRTTAYFDAEEYTCRLNHLSCRYIDSLDKDIIIKEFYKNIDDAKASVKSGHAIAAMYIPKNFTRSTNERAEYGRSTSDDSIRDSTVSLWLDMSNHQLAYFMQKKLYTDYVSYSATLFKECTYAPRLADLPIKFEEPLYGSNDTSFLEFMVPGVMITILFFLATTATSTIIITDKLEGVWDRTIVAGVKSEEILIVHIFIQTMVLIVQTLEIMIIVFTIYQIPYDGNIFNIGILLLLQGVAGMCFGFVISIICDTYTLAFFVSTGSFYPMILLCGIVWPIEGMAPAVRYISMLLPFTIPIISMRNIIEKGFTVANILVYDGYLSTFAWIIGLLVLCYALLRIKRK